MYALTGLLGRPVVGPDGARVGALADLVVDVAETYPVVSRLVVRTGRGQSRTLPWAAVARLGERAIELSRVADAPLRHELLFLRRDVLDVQIVDLRGKRLTRVADVELAPDDHGLRVVAVDVGASALLQRLGLRSLAARLPHAAVDWQDLHFASGRAHALQLPRAASRVQRLSADELAELVARLPAPHADEVLRVVTARPPEALVEQRVRRRRRFRRRFGNAPS